MQFITNGPDIPDALLQAHEKCNVKAAPQLAQDARYLRLGEYSRRRGI